MDIYLQSRADIEGKERFKLRVDPQLSTVEDLIHLIHGSELFSEWNSEYAQLGADVEFVWNGQILNTDNTPIKDYGINHEDIIIAQPKGITGRVAGGAKHHKRKMRKKTNKKRRISKSRNRKSSKRNTRKRNTRK